MSKTKPVQAGAAPEWTPPSVKPGEFIMYSSDGTKEHMGPAVVTKVAPWTINAVTLGPRNEVQNGIRHIDDPRLKRNPEQITEFGCWMLSDAGEHMRRIEDIIEELAGRVAALESSRS